MNYQFLFIGHTYETINNKKYLCIYLLELNRKTVFRIFKTYKSEIDEKLQEIEQFEDVTNKIDFVIKRDNKISLDINL